MRSVRLPLAGTLLLFLFATALVERLDAQDKKKGSTIGTVTGKMNTPNGKNTFLEIKAPGDEAARKYRVGYDPAVKGPLAKVLQAVRASNIGDQVKLDWVDTGEGLAITKFEVLKKAPAKEDKKDK